MEVTRGKVVQRFARVVDDDTLAKRLEICLWNWTVTTCGRDHIALYWDNPRVRYRYTSRALGLEYNLKANPALLRRVTSKELSVKTFVHMTPQEMWPERWEEAYRKVALKQLKRETTVNVSNAPDGAFTCNRCKSKKTVYTSMQIRSADEPMTTFVLCLKCGKSWKD